jgi:hypothetical protein
MEVVREISLGAGTAPSELAAGRAALLEVLSERVLRHAGAELWRQLFLGPAFASIRFETRALTVLAADVPLVSGSGADRALLAERLAGKLEASRAADIVLAFDEARAALRAAVVLQRLAGHGRVRTALNTASATVACFDLDGVAHCVLLGTAIDHAESALAACSPGTIYLSASSYATLHERIGDEVRDGLVATELDNENVTQASIMLPPQAGSPMSTFAGLGLT